MWLYVYTHCDYNNNRQLADKTKPRLLTILSLKRAAKCCVFSFFLFFLSCLRLLLGHSLYSPKEKRQNSQELDKIMRKITMHRNLCRLRDRSNRELCISGCRLRLHNHFVSVYGSTRYVSKEINSN